MADSNWTGSGVYNPTQHNSTNESATPVDSQKGSANIIAAGSQPIPDSPIVGPEEQRILNRHIVSSASRGTQTTTGQNIINDPATANPVMVTSGITQNTIFSDPTTQTPRIIEGLLPDSTYGMWVSKPGIDVTTAGVAGLIFNSNQDILKVIQTNTTTFNFSSSAISTGKIAHGLNFTPLVLAFVNNVDLGSITSGDTTTLPLPSWMDLSVDTTNAEVHFNTYLSIFVDNQYFYATFFNALGTARNFLITYYLLQETATAPTPAS